MGYGWYIMEIATLFLAIGLAAGIANNKGPNELVQLFLAGCKISWCSTGGGNGRRYHRYPSKKGMIIDTILHSLCRKDERHGTDCHRRDDVCDSKPEINLVIPSGSAKRSSYHPYHVYAVLGLDQVIQTNHGHGLSVWGWISKYDYAPTSGVLMAVLGVSRIPYDKWVRWSWKFILFPDGLLGAILLLPTVLIPMNGF